MTVAWDAVEAACEAWALAVVNGNGAVVAGADGYVPVIWRDKPKTHTVGPYIELSIEGESAVGQDDIVYIDVADELTVSVAGAREFNLEVSCRSRDQGALRAARNHLEKLRASLHHPHYAALLEAGGCAFHTAEPIRTIPFVNEGRRESLAVLEIRLGTSSSWHDETASIDYALTADVEVTVGSDDPILITLPEP